MGKIKRPRIDLRFCLVHIAASFPDVFDGSESQAVTANPNSTMKHYFA
jgi:hypothetical protein